MTSQAQFHKYEKLDEELKIKFIVNVVFRFVDELVGSNLPKKFSDIDDLNYFLYDDDNQTLEIIIANNLLENIDTSMALEDTINIGIEMSNESKRVFKEIHKSNTLFEPVSGEIFMLKGKDVADANIKSRKDLIRDLEEIVRTLEDIGTGSTVSSPRSDFL